MWLGREKRTWTPALIVWRAAEAKAADANTFEAVGKLWFDKQTMSESTRVRDGRILGYLYKELGLRPIGTGRCRDLARRVRSDRETRS